MDDIYLDVLRDTLDILRDLWRDTLRDLWRDTLEENFDGWCDLYFKIWQ